MRTRPTQIRGRIEALERRDLLTVQVLGELPPIALSSDPTDLVVAGDFVYFTANIRSDSPEVWITDGTPSGTRSLEIDGGLEATLAHRDDFFFSAGETLYVDAGETGTAVAITDELQRVVTNRIVPLGENIYFGGQDADNDRAPLQPGFDLMYSDGSPGTARYLYPTAEPRLFPRYPHLMDVWDGQLYYVPDGGDAYRTNGAVDGTHRLGDFRDWTHGTTFGSHIIGRRAGDLSVRDRDDGFMEFRNRGADDPRDFLNTPDGVYLISTAFNDRDAYGQVWFTDGTPTGTRPLTVPDNFFIDAVELAWFADRLWIASPHALWSYRPATETIELEHEFPVDGGPIHFAVVGDQLYFNAVAEGSRSIHYVDSTSGQVHVLSTPNVTDPDSFTQLGSQLLFSAFHPEVGRELWSWDSNTSETLLLADIHAGVQTRPVGQIDGFFVMEDLTFFTMDDGRHGEELWRTDGTVDGTFLLRDIYAGFESSNVDAFFAHDGEFYFTANDGIHGEELWKSDGTTENTVFVVDVAPGLTSSSPSSLVAWENALYFFADDGVHGRELWKTDGTPGGTQLVQDMRAGEEGWELPLPVASSEERLVFATDENVYSWNGQELAQLLSVSQSNPGLSLSQYFFQGERLLANSGRRLFEIVDGSLLRLYSLGTSSDPNLFQLSDGSLVFGPAGRSQDPLIIYDERDAEREITTFEPELFQVAGERIFAWRRRSNSELDLYAYEPDVQSMKLIRSNVDLQAVRVTGDLLQFEEEVRREGILLWTVDQNLRLDHVATLDQSPVAVSRVGSNMLVSVVGPQLLVIPDKPALEVATVQDVDAMFAALQANEYLPRFDADGDSRLDRSDVELVFREHLKTSPADFDLDGEVSFADFLQLSANFGRTDAKWSQGDTDGDGTVGFGDFLLLSKDFGKADGFL